MKKEIKGYYGKSDNPCVIFYYNGWYAIKGSCNINYTNEELNTGINVERVFDIDTISADDEIECIEDLVNEVDD